MYLIKVDIILQSCLLLWIHTNAISYTRVRCVAITVEHSVRMSCLVWWTVPSGPSTSSTMVVPYSGSQGSLHHTSTNPSLRERAPSFPRQRHLSGPQAGEEAPPSSLPYAQSPPNMEGPIMFVAPELAEETLMDVSENLAK